MQSKQGSFLTTDEILGAMNNDLYRLLSNMTLVVIMTLDAETSYLTTHGQMTEKPTKTGMYIK